MTNEERQQAIEWLKGRPITMPGAKRMYDLAVEALEAYVPDMNVGETEPSRESDTEITRCSDDTISRQAAIDAVKERYYKYGRFAKIEELVWSIEKLPSAQQEIIHCKDCKYWKEKPLYAYCEKMYKMGILDVLDYATEENDFCSMAEKRGGEDDETDCDYERAVEQLEHDMLYEPTFNKDD